MGLVASVHTLLWIKHQACLVLLPQGCPGPAAAGQLCAHHPHPGFSAGLMRCSSREGGCPWPRCW
eukprot:1137560-Pelagomonas_calceolata.AAC.4